MMRDAVLEAPLALSHDDQAVVLDRLIASLDQPPGEIDRARATENDRRIAACRRGEIEAVDAEEVLRRQRERRRA